MRLKIIFLSCSLLASGVINAQKSSNYIELRPYTRMDWYPEFTYSINPTNYYMATIRGTSWGMDVNYKFGLKRNLLLKIGAGYFRYTFNKIEGSISLAPRLKSNSRLIFYPKPSPTLTMFSASKYWYHTASVNLGIDKVFEYKNSWQFNVGLMLKNYFTFSQTYYIDQDYPEGPPNHLYKRNKNRYFGLACSLESGILKKIGNARTGLILIIPVYDMWKQDEEFPGDVEVSEHDADSRHKWFRGIGAGISVNFALGK